MHKNLGGHVTVTTPLLGKFSGVTSELSLGTRESNLKSVTLTVLELLAFNPPKIFGYHVRTVLGNTCVKFDTRVPKDSPDMIPKNFPKRGVATVT